jgi:hypothetical protein
MESQESQKVKTMSKKNKVGGLAPQDFKTHCKVVVVIKTV